MSSNLLLPRLTHPGPIDHTGGRPRVVAARAAPAWPRSGALLVAVLVELVIVVGGYHVYSIVRVLVAGREAEAMSHGWAVLRAEQSLHLSFERPVQRTALHATWLVQFFNWVYYALYLPFIAAVGVYLFVHDRERYAQARRTFLVSGAVGLVIFARFPVAPPRLLSGSGIADTVLIFDPWAAYDSNSAVNQFAAIPSFHFGWSALAAYSLARSTTVRGVRLSMWAVPPLMLAAIVITGNHLWFDALVAALVVVPAYALAAGLGRLRFRPGRRGPAAVEGRGAAWRPRPTAGSAGRLPAGS